MTEIINADTSGYRKKYAFILTDSSPTINWTAPPTVVAFKTSDGHDYLNTNTINHTWNPERDKPCSKGYATRYIICYVPNDVPDDMSIEVMTPKFHDDSYVSQNILHLVISNIQIATTAPWWSIRIQDLEFINGTNIGKDQFDMNWFFGLTELRKVPENLDVSHMTSLAGCFSGAWNIQTIPKLDVGNCTNFEDMFYNCKSLRKVPKLNTFKGENMDWMFTKCISLVELPEMDTSNVKSMRDFASETNISKIPRYNTGKVENFQSAFQKCYGLTDFPEFDYSSAINTSMMFYDCPNLGRGETITKFNTANATDMNNMFGLGTARFIPELDMSSVRTADLLRGLAMFLRWILNFRQSETNYLYQIYHLVEHHF